MKLRHCLPLFLIITGLPLFGSSTVIKGNAKQFAGTEIIVTGYKDYISKEKTTYGYTNIAKDGNYLFEFDLKEVRKVILKIEDKTTWFFVEPGKVYNINLTYSDEENKGRVYDKELSLQFNFPVPTELNQQIKKFNTGFDQFIDENTLLFKKRDRSVEPKLKSYKAKVLKELDPAVNPFVKNYIIYTFASTQTALDVAYKIDDNKKTDNTKANIFLEYLNEKPVLYNNPEYMNFFREFFGGEMKTLSLKLDGFDISKAINDKSSYAELIKALSKYPFLQDDEFKNLFMLHSLLEASHDKYFTRENILNILEQVKTTSPYPEQQEIAANIMEKMTRKKFGEGSMAPGFQLTDQEGKKHSLSNFKGKPVYISFWTNWSIPALKEMKVMETLHKKHKGKVHFISICADNEYGKMTRFLEKNPSYNWLFLHVGDDKKLLDKYSVMTYPTYVLLDQNLKVYKFPAGRPGGTAERATEDNIEKDFYDLTKK
ncbi:MAG: TlpA family protein disulfide reductase [Flavobacteriales bacterium]|nr:TlpA family protein disulfide reductase [Flavobacteriales bacterium]